MADSIDTDLAALAGSSIASGDVLTLVDVSDTSMAATGTNKKTTAADVLTYMQLNGSTVTCKQSAQVTNSSNTTPTDITGLSFSLTSGRRYYFKFMVTFQTDTTTTGAAFMFSAPAMTHANFYSMVQQAANGTAKFYAQQSTTLTTQAPSASVIATGTDYIAFVEGFCQPSAGGTLQLRVRSEINASVVTVAAYGVGLLTDLG